MALAFVAAVLCLGLVLAGASMGMTGSLAFSQPSPSGSPSGSPSDPPPEPGAIFLLNPNPGFIPDMNLEEPPADPEAPSLPKISDKFDGKDRAYHVVAAVNDPPPNAFVEAYWVPNNGNEITAGQMAPLPDNPDVYELFWDIPETVAAGSGLMRVRLYRQTSTGFEEISSHEVAARLQHKPSTGAREAETVALTWPSMGGPLGWFKGSGGTQWRTVLDGTGSSAQNQPNQQPSSTGIDQVRLYYSTTPAGADPQWTHCVNSSTSSGGPEGSERFSNVTCALPPADVGSAVTAIAALAMQDQDPNPFVANYTVESSDVHWVESFAQNPNDMTIDLVHSPTSDYPAARRTLANTTAGNCLTYLIRVRDQFERPVMGANVDVHVDGPNDQIQFGHDQGDFLFGAVTSSFKNPDKQKHSSENAHNCYPSDTGPAGYEQAETNVPGGDDVKHLESSAGTGLSGGSAGVGDYRFGLKSTTPGFTEITAWIDEEQLAVDKEKRPLDDDLPEPGEKVDTNFAQWLRDSISVSIDPAGKTVEVGSCTPFIVKVRSASAPVPEANVDVHAQGPEGDLDFCDPGEASPHTAPDKGTDHNAEDAGESTHSGQPPTAQHTEGTTNDAGNFVIGLRSTGVGDTTITAWYDGEENQDNDNLDSGEPQGNAVASWLTGDAKINFVNPSPYGSDSPGAGDGTQVGTKQDVDSAFHVTARVASLQPVAGVEFFVRTDDGPLVKIGDGVQVNQTDAWELHWPVDVPDGDHTLVARITGTQIATEQDVVVDNDPPMVPAPGDAPFETLEISSPANAARATFTRGKLTVKGVASSGTEGVDLFYTRVSALTTPAGDDWTFCGFTRTTPGSAPIEFSAECELKGADQPSQVTGIAALPYDCLQSGCNSGPEAGPEGTRNPGSKDSGDAHRVFGIEATPLLGSEPAEAAGKAGTCQKFVITLQDQTGQPMADENLDAHLSGPGNGGNFCSPEDGSGTPRTAPDGGDHTADGDETDEAYHDDGAGRVHHTEGDTTSNGRFVVGIESAVEGDSQLTVWLDGDGDDVLDDDEVRDVSIMHWETGGGGGDDGCDISGTAGSDRLIGTGASERICGFGGNDTIKGRGGHDTILGGRGRDVLRGNSGADVIKGAGGLDKVLGGKGGDQLRGGGANDTLRGHRGNDRLFGHGGHDLLDGGNGRDSCRGGKGRDRARDCEATRSARGQGFARRTSLI